ncbi:hypothetical protein IAR50_006569 [Cryptococcus sp. DSM 104548]
MALDYDQFKGKPFQVISKLGVRYTGIFDHISQEDQTICLAQVYNRGTEDRPTARQLPGSTKSLGWVRFRTESIESISLVENYVAPGTEPQPEEDPILASVSQDAPSSAQQPPQRLTSPPEQRYDLPAKPSTSAISAATALSRVERSLSELSTNDRPQRRGSNQGQYGNGYARGYGKEVKQPEVPDAEFDFAKANEKFEKERGDVKSANVQGPVVIGEVAPNPALAQTQSPPSALSASLSPQPSQDQASPTPAAPKYQKSSFFDNISHSTGKVSRNEERHRNLDTFGEAGGPPPGAFGGQGRGGCGGRGRGRGEFGYNGGTGGDQQGSYGGYGYGNRGRGGYNRGGGRGGYGQQSGGDL